MRLCNNNREKKLGMQSLVTAVSMGIMWVTVCNVAIGADLQLAMEKACWDSDRAAVKQLIEDGAEVNRKTGSGGRNWFPLTHAVYQ